MHKLTFLSMGTAALVCGLTASRSQTNSFDVVSPELAAEKGCLSCHEGLETIREAGSQMLETIRAMGVAFGDPDGCIICHGGNPRATTKAEAHSGSPETLKAVGPKAFYPNPGSLPVATNACGLCHGPYVYRMERSLMNTQAGEIQSNLHAWGVIETHQNQFPWANYEIADPDGPRPITGTAQYASYLSRLQQDFPRQFPERFDALPRPTAAEVTAKPERAGIWHHRQRAAAYHVQVKGPKQPGQHRGAGCAACHLTYRPDGFYGGGDPTIPREQPGFAWKHRIVGTREAGGGIPLANCTVCHFRGKNIAATYQGWMESNPIRTSPPNPSIDEGTPESDRRFLYVAGNLHHQITDSRFGNPEGAMLCQDCHTTIDVHGDGNLAAASLAAVEIECEDCHGTTTHLPWELPLGTGDEFGRSLASSARGLGSEVLMETQSFGTVHDRADGYLLTARGNPFGNVIKEGGKVFLMSASGTKFEVPLLKTIRILANWKNPHAQVAMDSIRSHQEKMECYTCHATWSPQFYGQQVKVDLRPSGTENKAGRSSEIDWPASGARITEQGLTADAERGSSAIPGLARLATRLSFARWEEPILGFNGEGRVTPILPADQIAATVISAQNAVLTTNFLAVSPDEITDANPAPTPWALNISPAQPHSSQRVARSCESCHNQPKTMGLGMREGVSSAAPGGKSMFEVPDPETGKVGPEPPQDPRSSWGELHHDWTRVVDEEGRQIVTVGSQWPLSRALNQDEQLQLTRLGLCLGCHREMTNEPLWNAVNSPGRLSESAHLELMNNLLRIYFETRQAQ